MKSLRNVLDALLVFFLFMGCTLVFYYGILWVSDEYKEYHRYEEPQGRAVKVVQQGNPEFMEESLYRLRLFIRHGE